MCSNAGRTPSISASDLAWTRHGKAIAGPAADAMAVGPVVLEEADAAGRVERVVAGLLEVVRQLLDARLVGQRRERVLGARVALRGVLAVVAVDLVEVLGPGVVRLHVVVRDRPGRRDPVVVAELAEVLAAAGDRGPRRTSWSPRRPRSGCPAGTACPCRRTRSPWARTGSRRRPLSSPSSRISRGSQSPRSRIRIRLPDGAR